VEHFPRKVLSGTRIHVLKISRIAVSQSVALHKALRATATRYCAQRYINGVTSHHINFSASQTGTVTDRGQNEYLRFSALSNAGYEPDGHKKTNQDAFISFVEFGPNPFSKLIKKCGLMPLILSTK
jgi:hypothetical protein